MFSADRQKQRSGLLEVLERLGLDLGTHHDQRRVVGLTGKELGQDPVGLGGLAILGEQGGIEPGEIGCVGIAWCGPREAATWPRRSCLVARESRRRAARPPGFPSPGSSRHRFAPVPGRTGRVCTSICASRTTTFALVSWPVARAFSKSADGLVQVVGRVVSPGESRRSRGKGLLPARAGHCPRRPAARVPRRSARPPRDSRPGGSSRPPRADTEDRGCRAAERSAGTDVPGFARPPAPGQRRTVPGLRRLRELSGGDLQVVDRARPERGDLILAMPGQHRRPFCPELMPERSRSTDPAKRWPNPWAFGSGQSSRAWI